MKCPHFLTHLSLANYLIPVFQRTFTFPADLHHSNREEIKRKTEVNNIVGARNTGSFWPLLGNLRDSEVFYYFYYFLRGKFDGLILVAYVNKSLVFY